MNEIDKRTNSGHFIPGNKFSSGRPKGSRNKLSEDFLSAFADDFAKHGTKVIENVRVNYPVAYLRMIAAIVPKKLVLQREGFPVDYIDVNGNEND